MRLVDTRPPFAGLANLSEGALASLPTPCYLLDEAQLRRNGEILLGVQQRTGCKILLAQKAFSNFDLYPLLAPYLAGTEASGLYESRLGKEELPEKENHVFCAAYRVDEFNELLDYADHIVFNSPAQLAKFGPAAKAAGKSVGLRINPERSTQEGHAIYDPCAPGSRLGTTRAQWDAALAKQPGLAALLDGLHFHTLCEQDADALAVTLDAVEEKFGDLLQKARKKVDEAGKVLDEAGVVWQMAELGKVDAGGGGTVACYMAERDIDTLDAGVPVLSMHAPFETVSKLDCYMTFKGMKAIYEA